MGQFFVIKDEHTLKMTLQAVVKMFNKNGWLSLTPSTKKRSRDANSLSHAWYKEIADQKCDQSAFDYKCQCKLHHGVPILRRDNEEFRAFYDRFFKHLAYTEKLDAIKHISITSTFNKDQMKEYLTEMQRTYAGQGIILTSINEVYR